MQFFAILVKVFAVVDSACAESAFPQAGAFPWEFLTLLTWRPSLPLTLSPHKHTFTCVTLGDTVRGDLASAGGAAGLSGLRGDDQRLDWMTLKFFSTLSGPGILGVFQVWGGSSSGSGESLSTQCLSFGVLCCSCSPHTAAL